MNIPEGMCQCGCGQPASIAKYNWPKYGWIKGKPKRYIHNHHQKGHKNNRYNMGLSFNKSINRWRICCRDGSIVLFARAVMEAHIKRELLPEEVVHHINGDSTDDGIENLELFPSKSAHRTGHKDKPRNPGPKYSNDFLIDKLREFYKKTGKRPTHKTVSQNKSMPAGNTYSKRFRGFKNALREANIIE